MWDLVEMLSLWHLTQVSRRVSVRMNLLVFPPWGLWQTEQSPVVRGLWTNCAAGEVHFVAEGAGVVFGVGVDVFVFGGVDEGVAGVAGVDVDWAVEDFVVFDFGVAAGLGAICEGDVGGGAGSLFV